MGVSLRKLVGVRIIVVFGGTTRLGRCVIRGLSNGEKGRCKVVLPVPDPTNMNAKSLQRSTKCIVRECDLNRPESIYKIVQRAHSVLLISDITPAGIELSRRVIDAVQSASTAQSPIRFVMISSVTASTDLWMLHMKDDHDAYRDEHSSRNIDEISLNTMRAQSYKALEEYAAEQLRNSVSLRVPLLMETLLECRSEVIYANRITGCFEDAYKIPCISMQDVATAAAEVLMRWKQDFDKVYTLTSSELTTSPSEVAHFLSNALDHRIRYRYVPAPEFLYRAKRDGLKAMAFVQSLVQLEAYLEWARGYGGHQNMEIPNDIWASNHYQTITNKEPTSVTDWINSHAHYFEATSQNDLQLFVLGDRADALFQEIAQLELKEMASAFGDKEERGEEESIDHRQVTLCSIRAASEGTNYRHLFEIAGQPSAPLGIRPGLGPQLHTMDVVLLVPPLCLGGEYCQEIVELVINACVSAKVCGIVMVSSIFAKEGAEDELGRLYEMEQYLVNAQVAHTIIRFPLFMEYFCALSSTKTRTPSPEGPIDSAFFGAGDEEHEGDKAAKTNDAIEEREPQVENKGTPELPLSELTLANTLQYFISMNDAAKAVATMAWTFPLHRGRTFNVYSSLVTMDEALDTLQDNVEEGKMIAFDQVDAKTEARDRLFAEVGYWPQSVVQKAITFSMQAYESNVGREVDWPAMQDVEELIEIMPLELEDWAREMSSVYSIFLGTATRSPRETDLTAGNQMEQEL